MLVSKQWSTTGTDRLRMAISITPNGWGANGVIMVLMRMHCDASLLIVRVNWQLACNPWPRNTHGAFTRTLNEGPIKTRTWTYTPEVGRPGCIGVLATSSSCQCTANLTLVS
jgi:hypothetical protein